MSSMCLDMNSRRVFHGMSASEYTILEKHKMAAQEA